MKNLKGVTFTDTELIKEKTLRNSQKEVYLRPSIEVHEVDTEPFLASTVNYIIQRNTVKSEKQDAKDAYDYSAGTETDDTSWDY